MTKVTILGEEPQKKEPKKIQAIACIQSGSNGVLYYSNYNLGHYETLDIIKLDHSPYPFDCVIIGDKKHVFIGHFNNGVV